jgi:hypothetical protein
LQRTIRVPPWIDGIIAPPPPYYICSCIREEIDR